MKEQTLVSVLMTAFNREEYIAEAIESVLSSSYRNFELIIVDDCSNDNTVSIARNFEAKDSRIKIYVNESNLGDYPNRNRAAGYATGGYIMYVDSDDRLLPGSIQKCVTLLLGNPNLNFALYYPEQGINEAYTVESKTAIKRQYFKSSFLQMGPGGIFIRRLFFESIGRFPEKYGPANDMYFNINAASKTDMLILPFPLVFYRRHEGQEVNDEYAYIHNNYKCNRDLISDLDLPLTKKEKRYIQKKNFFFFTFKKKKKKIKKKKKTTPVCSKCL
jgi:glycosyltransferase involved in cell wall biosynthesis